jgi:hypothetical protein
MQTRRVSGPAPRDDGSPTPTSDTSFASGISRSSRPLVHRDVVVWRDHRLQRPDWTFDAQDAALLAALADRAAVAIANTVDREIWAVRGVNPARHSGGRCESARAASHPPGRRVLRQIVDETTRLLDPTAPDRHPRPRSTRPALVVCGQ